MYQKIYLNNGIFSYLRGELTQGGELSQHLLELDLEKGVVFTYIPNGFDLSDHGNYSESMEFKVGKRVAHEFEAITSEAIYEFLDRDSQNVAIFETPWTINDPIVAIRDHHYFLIRSMVYDILLGSSSIESIKQYLRGAQSYPTMIVLSTNFHFEVFLQNMELNDKTLKQIIENCDSLIVGAFDGEGFLFWTKQETKSV